MECQGGRLDWKEGRGWAEGQEGRGGGGGREGGGDERGRVERYQGEATCAFSLCVFRKRLIR